MRHRFLSAIALVCAGQLCNAQIQDNPNIEMAARINVAENLCDINFGDRLLHHVMLAASQLGIGLEAAAVLADRRHTEIVAYLNRQRKLDEFCISFRAGKP